MLLTTGQQARIATLAVIRLDAAITPGPQMEFGRAAFERPNPMAAFVLSRAMCRLTTQMRSITPTAMHASFPHPWSPARRSIAAVNVFRESSQSSVRLLRLRASPWPTQSSTGDRASGGFARSVRRQPRAKKGISRFGKLHIAVLQAGVPVQPPLCTSAKAFSYIVCSLYVLTRFGYRRIEK